MACIAPSQNCDLCSRLAAFRGNNRTEYTTFFNAPVPSFGSLDAELLVVGLAPGLKGANRTGRPFTGDYAGLILYAALKKHGFAAGEYEPEKVAASKGGHSADGFHLINCRVTNAVRCVPPGNKPEPAEIKQCNAFLVHEIKAMPNLKAILTLGQIAHKAVLVAFGLKQSAFAFGHGACHKLPSVQLFNSYHCSRYNINTGVLTPDMLDDVMRLLPVSGLPQPA